MQSIAWAPLPPRSQRSLIKSAVSRWRNGTYDCTLGRLRALAAAFRRRFSDSDAGDVPIVNPAVDDRTCH